MIRFNKPYFTGQEIEYLRDAIDRGRLSGNNLYTQKVQELFEKKYCFNKTFLTPSCTDALEMSAILTEIEAGDEVIAPAYTFVSTCNAFILRGAKIVFADSYNDHPNIDPDDIKRLISPKTKALVVVHYGGVACDMGKILEIAHEYNLRVIEDAAQAVDAYYKNNPLGGVGDFGAFSFHETKNISGGEGGMLVVNNQAYMRRAEIIWEKGTNRAEFFRGEVDKYNWVDIGSSFLPSELVAAFIFAQAEQLGKIQQQRIKLWNMYYELLQPLKQKGVLHLPKIPEYATNNAHLFYIVVENLNIRTRLIEHLKSKGVNAIFHYIGLHKSPFYKEKHSGRPLPNCDKFTDRLLRLPLYYELKEEEVHYIVGEIFSFYNVQKQLL